MPKHKNRVRRMYSVTLDTLLVAQTKAVGLELEVGFSQQVDEALRLYLDAHRGELVEALARAGETPAAAGSRPQPPADPPPSPSISRVSARERGVHTPPSHNNT